MAVRRDLIMDAPKSEAAGAGRAEREAFYRRIAAQHLAPLWEVLH